MGYASPLPMLTRIRQSTNRYQDRSWGAEDIAAEGHDVSRDEDYGYVFARARYEYTTAFPESALKPFALTWTGSEKDDVWTMTDRRNALGEGADRHLLETGAINSGPVRREAMPTPSLQLQAIS